MEKTVILQLKNITKKFGSKVIANNNVSLDVYKGEILSILGENGCGKTTLMNMIAGIYYPDSGKIIINGEEVIVRSPRDAFEHKIGMIHQHFKLIDIFTAAQNVALGIENEKYNLKDVNNRIREMAEKYGFNINLNKKIYEMSVSEKQTVEILKVLYRGADILILDEPTAVLTPQEIRSLFAVLKAMRDDGKSIIIITHKLNEVMEISDRVTVLRKGEHIATVNTTETSEKELTEMMVGEKIDLNINRTEPVDSKLRLSVSGLTVKNPDGYKVVDDVTFEDDLLSMFLTFFVRKGDLYERFEEEHLERAYKEDEIEAYLKNANLEVINKFDGYTNDKVKSDSERLVYVVKKSR